MYGPCITRPETSSTYSQIDRVLKWLSAVSTRVLGVYAAALQQR